MNIPAKYIATFTLLIVAIFGWNAFLISRDVQLFKAHDVCKQFTHHPDCPK